MENIVLSLLFGLIVYIIVYLFIKIFFEMRSTLEKRMQAIERMGGKGSGQRQEKKKGRGRRKPLIRLGAQFEKSVHDAGLNISPENFLFVWILCAALPGMVGFLVLRSVALGILLSLAGLVIPLIYLRIKRTRRINSFSIQLGDALMIISNCLRSGLSFKQAMQRVTEDMPDPLRTEFQTAVAKMNYGAAMEDVLREIARDMEDRDMDLLNAAIGLNQKVGGSLADIVDTVVGTIRERIQIRQQLRTLTAMGRMSGWVIGLMPVIMLTYFMISNPDYMGWFFTSVIGNIVLAAAALWELIGILVIRKIVNIKL